jgi:SAM-dependent methyltransferase
VAVVVDPEREMAELREYLGPAYDHSRLQRYEQQLEEELARVGDEQLLYRTSEAYLYNLTAFAMTHTKLPYVREITRVVGPGARLLDYGCGIGSDGLALIEAGYDVSFADFDNPSTRYLRWRLDRRGVDARVYDLDSEQPPPGFDLAFAFDVIEHVDDPFAFLSRMEAAASTVVVNFLAPEAGETELHRELPIPALLAHAATRRLRRYRIHHRRSHLVVYDTERARRFRRMRSRLMLLRGRLRQGSSAAAHAARKVGASSCL